MILRAFISFSLSVIAACMLTGCYVTAGVDWHGQTGVDKRIQTQLVGTEQDREERRR